MSFSHRVGTFFILIGGFLIFLFLYSDTIHAPQYSYLLYGIIGCLIGMGLRVMAPAPPPSPPPTERFRILKRKKSESKKERPRDRS
jgi:hypothetical protein